MSSINIFPLNDNFSTGIAIIDEQHKKLVQILNQLANQVAFNIATPSLATVFDELTDYAVYHFQTEEGIWHEYLPGDSLEAAHKATHDSFVRKVIELKERSAAAPDAAALSDELLAFLVRWLVSHILEDDRYLAILVLAMQSGMPFEAARIHAQEEMSSMPRILIDLILSIYDSLSSNTLRLMRELHERKIQEDALSLQAKRDQAMLELPKAAEDLDEATFMQRGQELAEDLTGSQIAFIHFVNDDEETIELVTWSRRTIEHYCHAAFDRHYPVSLAGVWAEALRNRQPVVFNDYASHPKKHGLPEGHSELIRLISVPVTENGKIVMLTGVGNKATNYTDFDVETVQMISNFIWQLVQRRRGIIRIERLNQLYSALSRSSQAIVRSVDRETLFQTICQDIVELGGMKLAWIGLVDQETQLVKLTAAFGSANEYLDSLEISVNPDQPTSHGPTGTAIREHRPFWCQNFQRDPATEPWHVRGTQHGLAASASLPLICDDVSIGALTVYSDTVNAFDDEAQRLLVEMAMDISFALENFTKEAQRQLLLNEQRVILNSPLVALAKVKDRIVVWNNAAHDQFYGYGKDEMIGSSTRRLYPSQEAYEALGRNAYPDLAAGKIYRFEQEFVRKDGSHIWAELSSIMLDPANQVSLWSYVDITERKQAEEKLQLASLVYQNSSEGMLITDENNNMVAINQAFTALTGYEVKDVLGKNPRILSSGRQNANFYPAMWASINSTGRWQGELWNRRKNGETYPEWLAIDTIYKDDGSVHRRVALFQDITEKKKTEEELLSYANYDQLTLLPNRRLFNDRLEQEIRKANRDKCRTTLLFIDLDHFKDVNDTLGHDVGDKLLIEAAARIKSCVRDYDTVARLGGDEFTVILSKLEDTSDVGRIAQSIIDSLIQPFQLAGNESFISASIGIAIYPDDGTNAGELIRHADQALYVAKDEGRSRISFFTKAMQESSDARMQLGVDLRHAIYKGQLEVYYQPIVELATGHAHKAEALLRWRHPVHGFVSPIDFIPVAEDTGSILDIGDWVFLQAAQQVKKLMDYGLDVQISVNKSPVQFNSDSRDHNHWIEKLTELGLPGSAIAVEITEGLLINNNPKIDDKLLKLRDAGIQVSIDDFGTGYSSLSYLKKFDIDYLKIDQSFTRNLSLDSDEFAICEAIVVMAHKLGIKVISEGVETEQQRSLLKQIGCDYGQGYLFARPATASEFEKWLSKGL